LSPVTTNDIDLGTSSLEFKDAFFDGTVTADAFAGPLTGNVTGNASGTAATVTTAAQSNITSLGTLTTLTVDNIITNGSNIGHTSDTDLITLADGVVTVAGELDAATLDISGNADIDGTLEADAITINGTAIASVLSPIAGGSGIVTTGALDAGSITSGFGTIDTGSSTITTTGLISGGSLDIDNVLINGTTIGHTDDTDLITLADGIATVAGEVSMTTLDIGGTNVTSTAAELNLLDGITAGTVIASKAIITDSNIDITGGRNITISGELDAATGDFSGNVDVDGTLEADAITINGTAIASVLSPIAGGSGIVTTGALNAGSITSGFGTIDTGASAITTTGLISGGSLDIDNVLINGTTIGHTDDTDLITLTDGVVTVAGEISVTTLDIGGTNVTSTATELNLLDGVSGLVQADLTKLAAINSTAAEVNVLDGDNSATSTTIVDADRIVLNDAGTMVQVAVTDIKTYIGGGTSWQAVKTGNFTAAAGQGVFANTTSSAFTVTLPAGTIGDEVTILDYAGTFDSNALTVAANGSEKIFGSTDNLTVSTERAAFTLVFTDGTQGWLFKND